MDTTIGASRTRLLERAVAANAAFSLASGAVLAIFAAPLGEFVELPTWLVAVTGVGVIVFGASLGLGRRSGGGRRLGRVALAGDVGWVVTAVVVVALPGVLSTGGRWLLAAITAVVAGFAVVEWVGLRRSAS